MEQPIKSGRLSFLRAAMVIMWRDFSAIIFSRSFLVFLLGPLFPLLVASLAGGIGSHIDQSDDRAVLGIAMTAPDANAMIAARRVLAPHTSDDLPQFVVIRQLRPGESFNARISLKKGAGNLAAIVSGTPASPVLTGPRAAIDDWSGGLSLIAAQALGHGITRFPAVELAATATSHADIHHGQVETAQAAQTLLFLLTMLLAGMVLSNLVEEKSNKIIEVLAAAIPMDAIFLGKLFAMLAMSLLGICVWTDAGELLHLTIGHALPELTAPAVGWPLFIVLSVLYFSMAYLLLGSLFLAIGSMANTVREVQTLSMPVTMLQLLVFFFSSYAMAQPGSAPELLAVVFPFSSPFAMLARAAVSRALWPHALALCWQLANVAIFVRLGANLFRKRVMLSGPATGRPARRGWFGRRRPAS
ncbi:MAG: ABC transporter permease [Pseudomonadota bacterium]|nr:ABC transporter permease [Pseudomonadota bacterium]